jgi:hypothetical protein
VDSHGASVSGAAVCPTRPRSIALDQDRYDCDQGSGWWPKAYRGVHAIYNCSPSSDQTRPARQVPFRTALLSRRFHIGDRCQPVTVVALRRNYAESPRPKLVERGRADRVERAGRETTAHDVAQVEECHFEGGEANGVAQFIR